MMPKIIADKNEDDIYIIINNRIGDILYYFSCLDATLDKYPDKKFVIIGFKPYEKLLRAFQRDNRVRLKIVSDEEFYLKFFDSVIHGQLYDKAASHNILTIFLDPRSYKVNLPPIHNQRKVLNLPENSPITYHGLKKEPVISIPNFEANKDKIVIINPYSNSMKTTMYLHEAVCEELTRRGYLVYTNVVGTQEVVRGSLPLRCDIYEFYSIMCETPFIVSVRSGILDFAAPSGINMFVLYDNSKGRIYAPLEEWECSGKIKNVLFNTKADVKEVIEQLSQFINELKAEGRIS
ncbi:MAG: hypothetical protein IJU48_07750 [Synergistaceae bacterium]|nr:hypothetical protein [Synergistaceae bacterium]